MLKTARSQYGLSTGCSSYLSFQLWFKTREPLRLFRPHADFHKAVDEHIPTSLIAREQSYAWLALAACGQTSRLVSSTPQVIQLA